MPGLDPGGGGGKANDVIETATSLILLYSSPSPVINYLQAPSLAAPFGEDATPAGTDNLIHYLVNSQ